ncbi:MAG TPA: UPF0182 family protein [Candidatus Sulfotelmatobacter sp.]|nr:UPF0182 family protein [Candidatus Sulfotelmatobacter sp.]
MPWTGIAVAGVVVVAVLVILGLSSGFLVDWTWFASLGYLDVFWTVVLTRALLFGVVFIGTAGFLWLNGALAARYSRRIGALEQQFLGGQVLTGLFDERRRRLWRFLVLPVAAALGLLVALGEIGNWDVLLRFIHQVPGGETDPVFGRDIGFYLFSLPAYVALKNWLLTTLFLGILIAGTVYWLHGDIELDPVRRAISPAALAHGSALLGGFFAVKAGSYFLDRYLLLYGDNGVVVGAGYADLHIELPILWLLIGLAVLAAFASWANLRVRSARLPVAALVGVFGGSFVLSILVPGLVERFYVKPNELELEKPYIERNIALTRRAYDLHQIDVRPFPIEQNLTFQALQANRETIDNIRLWDWQPLMDTYAQLQEIRTYYKFHDVDVDRYHLDDSYQQVTLSARELKSSLLPANAQTWVNRHLLFTHGNGVVMSPVTRKTAEGLPFYYLQDIPPVATGGPTVREPRIYFGEETDDYVVVKGSVPEFDYPKGKDNIYGNYAGKDGVSVGNYAMRALFAWYFGDVNLLLSRYVTSDSRILFRRTIQERVAQIAPFLRLDHDPYVVVSDGRLFWIQDAYTTSDYFPYAQPLPGAGLNYIRNSVKIVVDAYNGTVDFYVADPSDPLVATYARIFPHLFKPLAAMPADLQAHVRYPEDLFFMQAQIYRTYHMESPEVFYNREDLWQFPREPSGGQNATMMPYYIIMRLPGEPRAELFLMLPMVPSQRENMIAWLAARCDAPDYGKVIVYEFPKDRLVYGPFQIEARINQNTEISQQLSLWNQLGSRVIRGNLLVIPIGHSVLYVSPLYLRAETGQLPELKRVIAAYGDKVVMAETLGGALAALFEEPTGTVPHEAVTVASPAGADDHLHAALDHYSRAIDALRAGNWATFGSELDALHAALEAAQHAGGGR